MGCRSKKIVRLIVLICIASNGVLCGQAWAKDLMSLTWDNGLMVGSDRGYTNGLYISIFDIGLHAKHPQHEGLIKEYDTIPDFSYALKPFKWAPPKKDAVFAVNALSLGQTMITPEDITTENPDPEDLPYAGQLFLTNTYVAAQANVADEIGITIGVIGSASGAEQSQKNSSQGNWQ